MKNLIVDMDLGNFKSAMNNGFKYFNISKNILTIVIEK